MKDYIVIGVSCKLSGRVKLSVHQYELRKHQLQEKTTNAKGIYNTISGEMLNFKNGEIIGFDGELNRQKLQLLKPLKSIIEKKEDVVISEMKRHEVERLLDINEIKYNKHLTDEELKAVCIKHVGFNKIKKLQNWINSLSGLNLKKALKDYGLLKNKNKEQQEKFLKKNDKILKEHLRKVLIK